MRFHVEEAETGLVSGEIEVADDGSSVKVISGTHALTMAVARVVGGFITPMSSLTSEGWAATNRAVRPDEVVFRSCVIGTLGALGFRPVW